MSLTRLVSLSALLLVLALGAAVACSRPAEAPAPAGQGVAEEFVRLEATFYYDGIPGTLAITGTTPVAAGWGYTIEFDSEHTGYGNRRGVVLAEVVTHHVAEVTVSSGSVTVAVMDGVWDMIKQRLLSEVAIELAPIQSVHIVFVPTAPMEVGVSIYGELGDGGTTVHDAVVARAGNTISIVVAAQHLEDTAYPAVATYFEKILNLGGDFVVGDTYTLKVNDYVTTFEMPPPDPSQGCHDLALNPH